jgi:uncharacterized delta-60 repeat protein
VNLARNGLSGAIDVALIDLPAGVTSPSSTIANAATSTVLTVSAAATAALGTTTVNVHSASGVVTDLPVSLTVAGPSGTLDETFDEDGILTDASDGNAAVFYAVLVQAGGGVLAGGSKEAGGWAIRRFDAAGIPDATFNQNAAAVMPTTGQLRGLAVDPNDGRIVAVGSTTPVTAPQLTVVRLNTTGTAHSSFANSGRIVFDSVSYPNGSAGYAAVVEADSSIVVAGSRRDATSEQALLVRLDAGSGAADATFTRYTAAASSVFFGLNLANGQLVAGGADQATNPPSTLLLRTDLNGVPDAGFGAGGVFSSNDSCRARAMVVQPSGHIAVAGQDITGPLFCAARATPTGTAAWDVSSGNGTSEAYNGVASMADDKIVVAGHGGGSFDKYATIVRLLPADGTPDSTFGDNGAFRLEDPATPDTYIYQLYAVTVQADGRIIAAGNKSNAGFALVRLWP